ncbi:hypothetical protein Tco_1308841 [Tanacetum coccineum]
MLVGLGYVNPKIQYWYKMPNKDALLPLSNDSDVLRFTKYVDRFKLMEFEVPDVAEQSKGSEDSEETKDNDFDVELEDKIDDVEVDMDDFRKFTDENVEWVGHDEVPIEDTQPVEAKVF